MEQPNNTLPISHKVALLAAVAAGLTVANPALAQDLSPVSDMLDNIVAAVTGPIGRGLSILAIVGAGIMMFAGRINWGVFLGIFAGVVLIFSAGTIVDGFTGGTATGGDG